MLEMGLHTRALARRCAARPKAGRPSPPQEGNTVLKPYWLHNVQNGAESQLSPIGGAGGPNPVPVAPKPISLMNVCETFSDSGTDTASVSLAP